MKLKKKKKGNKCNLNTKKQNNINHNNTNTSKNIYYNFRKKLIIQKI